MARSAYIYVVTTYRDDLVVAFTVKHELQSWLDQRPTEHYQVWRMSDGARRSPVLDTELTR